MGRPQSPLDADRLEQALVYLQRALDRKAPIFSVGLKQAGRSLAHLRKRTLTLRRGDAATEVNSWLVAHLTPDGRRKLLAALRQQKVAEPKATLRLSSEVKSDIARLASLLSVSPSKAVALVARAALSDAAFIARLRPGASDSS
jgi:hypothetical protein